MAHSVPAGRRLIRVLLLASLLVACFLLGACEWGRVYGLETVHTFEETVVAPDCYHEGYTLHTCVSCGFSYKSDYTKKTEHSFGAYVTVSAATETAAGLERATCSICGATRDNEVPPTLQIPMLIIDGNRRLATRDTAATVKVTYSSYETEFTTTATIQVQGFTSAGFDKKNYNIKFYTDDSLKYHNKQDLGFGEWGSQWRYVLKANWIDGSHSRNIVTCRLFGQMAETRNYLNNELLNAPNNGCTDGFPVRVYTHSDEYGDMFLGIYTMNIPKTKWMFAMDESVYPHSAIVTSQMHNKTNRFQATTNLYDTEDWDVEYCSTGENMDWLNTSFNNLIRFVRDSNVNTFRERAEEYIDIDAAIDYTIMCFTMYGPDNWDKNMVLVTYDGVKWVPTMYDADCAFGLHWNGQSFYARSEMAKCVPTEVSFTSIYTSNWLLSKTCYCFFDEFCERYWELRETVLSNEHIIGEFQAFMDMTPAEWYEKDREVWKNMPDPIDPACDEYNDMGQITDFVNWRMAALDKAMKKVKLKK